MKEQQPPPAAPPEPPRPRTSTTVTPSGAVQSPSESKIFVPFDPNLWWDRVEHEHSNLQSQRATRPLSRDAIVKPKTRCTEWNTASQRILSIETSSGNAHVQD